MKFEKLFKCINSRTKNKIFYKNWYYKLKFIKILKTRINSFPQTLLQFLQQNLQLAHLILQ